MSDLPKRSDLRRIASPGEFRPTLVLRSSRYPPPSSARGPATDVDTPTARLRPLRGRSTPINRRSPARSPPAWAEDTVIFGRTRALRVALILTLLIAAAAPGGAQTDRGTITG